MNKIKILSPQEAQKIAAGEVVERPANIVKETIENSIDAEANQISLYIQDSGKKLIRIVDNGSGMTQADAKLCFTPHATSKITKLDDLINISSFGFRGEALASISAVSKVTLQTNSEDENKNLGTLIEYEDGKFKKIESVAMQHGTNLQIKDLFYNTPVRKKFLKQDETEFNLIQNIFSAFCLSNLKIHFKLFKDDKLILNAPPVETVKDRASQIWGHNFAENLIKLDAPLPSTTLRTSGAAKNFNFNISGFISNHNFNRYGRQQMFFFVNNRYVKSAELNKALVKGYLNVLPPAKFPACFIFISLDNELVDINVHPKKEEVRFTKPKTIENKLQLLVQQTLQNNLNRSLKAQQTFKPSETSNITKTLETKTYETSKTENNFSNFNPRSTEIPLPFEKQIKNTPDIISTLLNTEPVQTINKIPEQNKQIKETTQAQNKIIGQLFQTYILIEGKDEFIIIDQHAAHERILYEGFLKNFEKKDGTRLIFPEIINLKENHLKYVLQTKDFLSNQGIEIEQFGQNQIAIKSSPPKIQNHDLKEYILDICDFIDENETLDSEIFRKKLNEHMHSHLACKMAIKAGNILSQEEMQKLTNDLQKTKNRLICVHGRPTTWIISKYQVERNFKRK
ncbi:MAG: DNA mismatch repair endonuclease MutL [bacterium]